MGYPGFCSYLKMKCINENTPWIPLTDLTVLNEIYCKINDITLGYWFEPYSMKPRIKLLNTAIKQLKNEIIKEKYNETN